MLFEWKNHEIIRNFLLPGRLVVSNQNTGRSFSSVRSKKSTKKAINKKLHNFGFLFFSFRWVRSLAIFEIFSLADSCLTFGNLKKAEKVSENGRIFRGVGAAAHADCARANRRRALLARSRARSSDSERASFYREKGKNEKIEIWKIENEEN